MSRLLPRKLRCASLLLFTFLLVATAVAGCSRPPAAAAQAPVDAAGLFAQACSRCHAADGTGGLPMVEGGPRPSDLTSPDWQRSRTDLEIVAAIRSGRGAMPPFEDVLTAAQIEALGQYVRSFKRP